MSNAARSTRQTSYVQKLVFAGLFVGVSSVLKLFEFNFSQDLRFNLVEIPWILSGIVLGPIWGFAVGAVSDVVQYFIKTTGAFNPGFTISSGLTGLVPGLVFLASKKQKGSANYAVATIGLFILTFLAMFWGVIRAGFLSIVDGQIYLRDSLVSYWAIAILFAAFVLSAVALVFFYRGALKTYGSLQPHKVLFSVAAAEVLCSLAINSALLYFMYGPGTAVTFPIRVFKVIVSIPVFTTISLVILNIIEKRKFIRFL